KTVFGIFPWFGGSEMCIKDNAEGRLRFRAMGDPDDPTPGRLTLKVIREELAAIVARRAPEDPHLHHLDGLTLYGEPDTAALPLPDDLHPDAETHRLIGERFAKLAFGEDGAFAP
ncbi:lipase, partial [Streptomyces scabiei]|nr:lipase [Streptomyces scabiei]